MISVRKEDLHKRDALTALQWNENTFANQEIGKCYGLTYSAVSRCIGQAGQGIEHEQDFLATYRQFNHFTGIKILKKRGG